LRSFLDQQVRRRTKSIPRAQIPSVALDYELVKRCHLTVHQSSSTLDPVTMLATCRLTPDP